MCRKVQGGDIQSIKDKDFLVLLDISQVQPQIPLRKCEVNLALWEIASKSLFNRGRLHISPLTQSLHFYLIWMLRWIHESWIGFLQWFFHFCVEFQKKLKHNMNRLCVSSYVKKLRHGGTHFLKGLLESIVVWHHQVLCKYSAAEDKKADYVNCWCLLCSPGLCLWHRGLSSANQLACLSHMLVLKIQGN